MVKMTMNFSSSSPTRNDSKRVANIMNVVYNAMVLTFDDGFSRLPIVLMNRMLTQISMIREKELVMNFLIISNTLSCSIGVWSRNSTMNIRIRNIPDASSRIHLRYGDDLKLMASSSFCPKTLVIPMMHHPRISVVTVVERQWTRYSESMRTCSVFAPNVPIRKPSMFTMITTVAVNSVFSPIFMQMIRAIAIVSTVRSSWSSIPDVRQTKATTAWSKANIWMVQGSPIDFIWLSSYFKSAPKLVILP